MMLTSYETEWLRECILHAAKEAGHPEWWPAGDVARGVENYLRHQFDGSSITLTELFDRLSVTLNKIGCGDIASHLRKTPPPVCLSLHELAKETDNKLEILFFKSLYSQLQSLRDVGFESFHFRDLRPCVKHLRSAKQWRNDCRQLAAEITQFLSSQSSDGQHKLPCELVISDH